MATIKTFEDLDTWQRARSLCQRIYKLTQEGSFAKDFRLRDQINGSSGSIMDNIAEGFDRDGRKEFILFLSIAKGSAGECRSQLYRAFDRAHINEKDFLELKDEVTVISKKIASFITYLKASEFKGLKFSEPEGEYENYKKTDSHAYSGQPET